MRHEARAGSDTDRSPPRPTGRHPIRRYDQDLSSPPQHEFRQVVEEVVDLRIRELVERDRAPEAWSRAPGPACRRPPGACRPGWRPRPERYPRRRPIPGYLEPASLKFVHEIVQPMKVVRLNHLPDFFAEPIGRERRGIELHAVRQQRWVVADVPEDFVVLCRRDQDEREGGRPGVCARIPRSTARKNRSASIPATSFSEPWPPRATAPPPPNGPYASVDRSGLLSGSSPGPRRLSGGFRPPARRRPARPGSPRRAWPRLG